MKIKGGSILQNLTFSFHIQIPNCLLRRFWLHIYLAKIPKVVCGLFGGEREKKEERWGVREDDDVGYEGGV